VTNKRDTPVFFQPGEDLDGHERSCDTSRWSPSGELCAMGFGTELNEEEDDTYCDLVQGEAAILIFSRQGVSLRYEQCLHLGCDQRYDGVVTIRALEFVPNNDMVLVSLHEIEYQDSETGYFRSKVYLYLWCNDGKKSQIGGSTINYTNVQIITYDSRGLIQEKPNYAFFFLVSVTLIRSECCRFKNMDVQVFGGRGKKGEKRGGKEGSC